MRTRFETEAQDITRDVGSNMENSSETKYQVYHEHHELCR